MMALLARFVPSLLPGAAAFLNPWVLLVVAAVAGGVWFHGYSTGRDKLDDYIAAQAVAATKIAAKRAEVTEKVVVKYIRVAGKTRTVTQYVDREVIKYEVRNPGICLDAEWRVLHDAAAANAVSGPAVGTDGAGGAPPAVADPAGHRP